MKSQLNYAEFYITNHCNIACNGCNRFNNYKYSGSENWAAYRDVYEEWSTLVDINHIAVLGGEPLLHPKLIDIVNDVRSFWPESKLEITTNGLLIERIKPELLQCLIDNNVQIYCSIHKESFKEQINNAIIDKFGDLNLLDSRRPFKDNPAGTDTFSSDAGNTIILEYTYYFHQSALVKTKDNKFTLHKSNYKKSHLRCDMKRSHHFSKGNLYKCGLMVTLPQMIEQKPEMFDIDKQQLDLLDQYKPIDLEQLKSNKDILKQLSNPIAQCEFCPEEYYYHEIFPN